MKAEYSHPPLKEMESIISPEEFAAVVQKHASRSASAAGIAAFSDDKILAAGGSICDVCGQRKLIADGCNCSYLEGDGQRYERIPYGDEMYDFGGDRCHDYGARIGFYHHPGCDEEQCPICM